ncbi:MAG: ABC transporter substrate-binding protein [Ilumatobacteraceae bacterium]
MNRTLLRSVSVLAVAALAAAACSSDDDDGAADTTAAPATTAASSTSGGSTGTTTSGSTETTTGGSTEGSGGGGGAVDLSADCPDPLVIQTDWFPEAEHGSLYQMVGEGYEIDAEQQVVTGPLVAGGEDTGIQIEIRTGGPAIGDQPVSVQQYADDSIHLGYANTEGQILRYDETPVLAVVAPLEINPQIIYWDPETYPDVETLADLGETDATINIFPGGTFAEVFVADGTWKAEQIDPSYDGSPARFIAEDGALAQQGFASAEPYTYENVFEEWGKPVAYQTLHDAGFEVYSQTLSIVPEQLETLTPCLEKFVPIVQQAAIDYIDAPDAANAIIVEAVETYDDFWVYDLALADYSVQTQKELGFIGNGPDDTLGNMDEARVEGVIEQIRAAGLEVPEDLTAQDLVTNQFVDPDIGL